MTQKNSTKLNTMKGQGIERGLKKLDKVYEKLKESLRDPMFINFESQIFLDQLLAIREESIDIMKFKESVNRVTSVMNEVESSEGS